MDKNRVGQSMPPSLVLVNGGVVVRWCGGGTVVVVVVGLGWSSLWPLTAADHFHSPPVR